MKAHYLKVIAVFGYVVAIYAANWLTSRYEMVHLPGTSLMVTAGTFAAGAALLMRDAVQDTMGKRWVFIGIGAGAAITAVTSPALALASCTAFLIAEFADMAVYTPLRKRGWARAVFTSNAVGAFFDTVIFLAIAGFPVTIAAVSGQMIGKVFWVTAIPVLVVVGGRYVRDAVSRKSLKPSNT